MLLATDIFPQKLLTDAWDKVNEVKLEEALEIFLKDAEENSNPDSYLAAAYLEEILLQNKNSMTHFFEALKYELNPAPFLVSAYHSPRIAMNVDQDNTVIDKMKEVAEKTKDGFIQIYMYEKIGKQYEYRAGLENAITYFKKMGAVKDWSIIGPFENISCSGFYSEFPPEKEFVPEKKYTGKENKRVNWFQPSEYRIDGWVDFLSYFPDTNSIYYANSFVYSEEKQKVQVRVGTSGSLRTFLNDQLILETYTETNNNPDTFIAETYLQKGWNRLLIKVGFSEIDYCNFLLRITNENGFERKDLKYSTQVQSYLRNSKESVTIIKSTVEKFFEDRLARQPDNPVNYLLLGEAYSINHKSYEAEKIYNDGMKRFPQNVLLPIHLAGRYMRDGNLTMYYTLNNKVDQRRDNLPIIIDAKLAQEIDNKNKENFIALYEKYIEYMPDDVNKINYEFFYNAVQNNPARLSETIEKAYTLYPDNYDFVYLKANLEYALTRNFQSTIRILENFVAKNFHQGALQYLGNLYVTTSEWEKWKGTYETLSEYEPAEPYYYYQMALKYYQMQEYENTKACINKAIAISPFNSAYYYLLGMCEKATDDIDKSKKAFQMAINYNFTNYDARDQLAKIDKDTSIDDEFNGINTEELISNSPGVEQYPSADAVTLLLDTRFRIFEGRASEYNKMLLIRVLNEIGVDWYSNVNVPVFSNQSLQIDKAYVIKSDGSHVDGEINGAQIIFKSLEKSDFVYLKYKIRNHNIGLLSSHLWEMQNFNSYQPIEKLRFALILPVDESIIIKSFKMDEEPSRTILAGSNKIMIWEKEKIPALEYEHQMPTIDDLGPNLYISTLEGWNVISNWYYDITRSKIREHYEIKDKIAKLFAGKENVSDRDKVKIIYDFIVKEISYVYVPFLQSEFVPQKASDVLKNKIGDCKDVVTLFIAMLNEVGINADYVLVRTADQGKLINAAAGMYFNHVIAVTYFDDEKQYYDLTAVDFPYNSLPQMLGGVLALEIRKDVTEPFFLPYKYIAANIIERNTKVEIDNNNAARITVNTLKSGESAAIMRSIYKSLSTEQKIKKLTEIISSEYSNYTVDKMDIENLDQLSSEIKYSYELSLNNFIGKTGNYKIFQIPWTDGLSQKTALSYNQRNYSYIINYQEIESEKILINLPVGYTALELPENISVRCPNAECSISYKNKNGDIEAQRDYKLIDPVVVPENYSLYKDFYNQVMEAEKTQILLKKEK